MFGFWSKFFLLVEMESRDWNAEWESNFNPVFIQDICTTQLPFIRMSEVTGKVIYIALRWHLVRDITNDKRYDHDDEPNQFVGGQKCWILEVELVCLLYTLQLQGAATIEAIDIEAPAYDNMLENFEANDIM